ncbi:hypothetical protein HNP86_002026 [Methanococcus maripaludis]|uniref:Uncharacterized protein n=1 Tax=Methanococcus maripaludis TaxID=39152 RepID=A0A7J9NX37_METMI|nr:hypothetical protein [Methanococcus maripaludis]MBA2851867.1 hypothetical protein [Methanococcus maripaludis]
MLQSRDGKPNALTNNAKWDRLFNFGNGIIFDVLEYSPSAIDVVSSENITSTNRNFHAALFSYNGIHLAVPCRMSMITHLWFTLCPDAFLTDKRKRVGKLPYCDFVQALLKLKSNGTLIIFKSSKPITAEEISSKRHCCYEDWVNLVDLDNDKTERIPELTWLLADYREGIERYIVFEHEGYTFDVLSGKYCAIYTKGNERVKSYSYNDIVINDSIVYRIEDDLSQREIDGIDILIELVDDNCEIKVKYISDLGGVLFGVKQ